jgi:hypothetical protein
MPPKKIVKTLVIDACYCQKILLIEDGEIIWAAWGDPMCHPQDV